MNQSVSIPWANCSDEVHRTFSLLWGGKATWAYGHKHDLMGAEDAPVFLGGGPLLKTEAAPRSCSENRDWGQREDEGLP